MFDHWYETDSDCCQHVRKDNSQYEMIQAVWLDLTQEDKTNGEHEYSIVKIGINLEDYTEEDKVDVLNLYGYDLATFAEEYRDSTDDIIAECLMAESILDGSYIIAEADSLEEAKKIIEEIVNKDNQ